MPFSDETIIKPLNIVIGFPLKIISFSGLKFCIQFKVFWFLRFNEYKEPLVDKNNKLPLLSSARLLSNLETALGGCV